MLGANRPCAAEPGALSHAGFLASPGNASNTPRRSSHVPRVADEWSSKIDSTAHDVPMTLRCYSVKSPSETSKSIVARMYFELVRFIALKFDQSEVC
jgi:hypothetical protein